MTKLARALSLAAVAALAACGTEAPPAPEPEVHLLPDADVLSIDLDLPTAPAGAPSGELVVLEAELPPALDLDAHLEARHLFAPVNASTRAVAAHLEALERAPATADGGAVVYGPLVRCMLPDQGCERSNEAEARVTVGIAEGGTVTFELTVRPVGATEEDEVVYARGWTRRGEAGTEGQLAIDLDALGAVGAESPYTGALALGFAKVGEAKALSFRLIQFRANGHSPGMFRAYTAYRNAAGVTRVRAADYVDVIPGPRGHELSVERLVAHPAYGERSFSLISNWVDSRPNGDVEYEGGWSENFWYRRSCRRIGGAAVEEWFLCASAQPLAQCVAGGPAHSIGPANASWDETCALENEPAEMAQPESVSFDANDASAEVGEDATGVAHPEAPYGMYVDPPRR